MKFLAGFALLAVACTSHAPTGSARRLALTFDDGPVLGDTVGMSAAQRNDALLGHLAKHRIGAALFLTCGGSAERLELARKWGEQGHIVGNHSSRHKNINAVPPQEYEADVRECDAAIHELPGYTKLFRFPFLKEGNTVERRDGFRAFLKSIDYRAAPVSIDASDWFYNQRLRRRIEADPTAPLGPYRDAYVAHLVERAEYYDALARNVVGRSVAHTLLLHHNLINALFLDDALAALHRRGWVVIDARVAFVDPVYSLQPRHLPAGESILWALAKDKGIEGLRYPAEAAVYEESKLKGL